MMSEQRDGVTRAAENGESPSFGESDGQNQIFGKLPQSPASVSLLAMRAAPRCQARSKSTGKRCECPAVVGLDVCYVHGGGGSGPPDENTNALKHGKYSRKLKERRERNAQRELNRINKQKEAMMLGAAAMGDAPKQPLPQSTSGVPGDNWPGVTRSSS